MLRTIYGTVDSDGSILGGEGFRVLHTKGTGIYDITFETPFAKMPGGSGTQLYPQKRDSKGPGHTTANLVFIYLDTKLLRLRNGNSDGNGTDRPFTFTITGD